MNTCFLCEYNRDRQVRAMFDKIFRRIRVRKKKEKEKKKNRIVTLFNVINYRDSGDCSVKK